jgi:hypothetical protein
MAVLDRLTRVVENMPQKPKNSFEAYFGGVGEVSGGSSSAPSTVPAGGRSLAAARLALARSLQENPEHFWQYFDAAALSAIDEQGRSPQDMRGAASSGHGRRYLERRARMGTHKPTISWSWYVAGAYDALVRGKESEARARLALLLIAGEQVAIDSGNWIIANELLLEPVPPFALIEKPGDPDAPHPATCDPQWSEVAIHRISERDQWRERKKKLLSDIRRPPLGGTGSGEGGDDKAAANSRREKAKAKAVAVPVVVPPKV